MATARDKAAWRRTAELLAQQYQIHRDPKRGRTLTSKDFSPYAEREPARTAAEEKVNVKDIKHLLMGMRPNPPNASGRSPRTG